MSTSCPCSCWKSVSENKNWLTCSEVDLCLGFMVLIQGDGWGLGLLRQFHIGVSHPFCRRSCAGSQTPWPSQHSFPRRPLSAADELKSQFEFAVLEKEVDDFSKHSPRGAPATRRRGRQSKLALASFDLGIFTSRVGAGAFIIITCHLSPATLVQLRRLIFLFQRDGNTESSICRRRREARRAKHSGCSRPRRRSRASSRDFT